MLAAQTPKCIALIGMDDGAADTRGALGCGVCERGVGWGLVDVD
jgi:hypothetical protein